MYKIILLSVCFGSVNSEANKNIYINDVLKTTAPLERSTDRLGVCPVPLTEEEVHAQIIDTEKVYPIWQLTPEQPPSRTFIRVPYYFSDGNSQSDDSSMRWNLIPIKTK